ncbi:MAG TPA: hypothetical protein DEA32_00185 [Firmicutes bacterium]|nr:hypothetical protein [Bacillota bacterium]
MLNQLEKGPLFTDREYLSKEQVQARYNLDDIDSIWAEVTQYRSLFRVELPVKANTGLPFFAVLTRDILTRMMVMDRRLFLAALRFNQLHIPVKSGMLGSALTNFFETLTNYYELPVTRLQIDDIIAGRTSSDLNISMLKQILDAQEKLRQDRTKTIDTDLTDTIATDIQGNDSEDIKADRNRIEPLFRIIADSDLPICFRFLSIFFWFDGFHPYEFSSDSIQNLLSKYFLSSEGLGQMPYAINLCNLCLNRETTFLKAVDLSLRSRDFNYFILTALPLLEEDMDQFETDLIRAEKDSSSYDVESLPLDKPSAPVKPIGVLKRELENTLAKKAESEDPRKAQIRENYPLLRDFQIDFYLSHNQIGRFYTLKQFMEAEDVVYETARTSMDLLSQMGFYRKGKAGKKFTYTPIPKEEYTSGAVEPVMPSEASR